MLTQAAPIKADFTKHEKTLQTFDGLTLFYLDFIPENSAKGTILCLPGITRNSKDFIELSEYFCPQGWRFICPDMRGRGRSGYDPNPINYIIPVENQDILTILTAENIDKAVFLGTSRGGLQTMTLALYPPFLDLIQGVILNDVGIDVHTGGLKSVANGLLDDVYPSLEIAANALKIRDKGRTIMHDQDWLDYAKRTFSVRNNIVYRDYDPQILLFLQQNLDNIADLSFLEVGFHNLKPKPSLLIRGENSTILTMQTVEKMQDINPQMQFANIPNRGHVPFLNEHVSLVAIDRFLHANNF